MLNILRDAITAVCIEKLGLTWDKRYGQLVKYKEKYGNCNVPATFSENQELSNWVINQRQAYKKKGSGSISKKHINLLEKIDFVWNIIDSSWEDMYGELVKYKRRFGHCNVPAEWYENLRLGHWVSKQRKMSANKKISKEHSIRLNKLEFVWDAIEEYWEKMFKELTKYKKSHGDCNVPRSYKNGKLANWVRGQRVSFKKRKLREDYKGRLNDIEFEWDPNEFAWNEMFNKLLEYKEKQGGCNVPSSYKNKKLKNWVTKQRVEYKNDNLEGEYIKRLNQIGFEWNPIESYWNRMFRDILIYKNQHGDCNVPKCWPNNQQLSNWVGVQRNAYKKEKLREDYIKRLNEIEFVWNTKEIKKLFDEDLFNELLDYKQKNGNCNVPQDCRENRQLGKWVANLRQGKRNKKIGKEDIKRLNDICFSWNTLESNWEEMFHMLVRYKDVYGSCNVPSRWPKNLKLANWVAKQRRDYKKEKVSKNRRRQLEDEGFTWNIRENNKRVL